MAKYGEHGKLVEKTMGKYDLSAVAFYRSVPPSPWVIWYRRSLCFWAGAFFCLLGLWLFGTGEDERFGRLVYHLGGNRFLQDDPLWYGLYRFQKLLAVLIAAGSLLFLAAAVSLAKPARSFTAAACLSALLTIGAVALLKGNTTAYCPWDLKAFGGDFERPGLRLLFDIGTLGRHHCFPAGHASGAYGWLGWAFFAPRRRLLLGGLIGLAAASFSVVQSVRGAHFISHDFITVAIGFWSIWLVQRLWWFASFRRAPSGKF